MPTRLKGMTSLEIAIIVAIVLVIAVAVGWYIYTTVTASTAGQPRLNAVSAEILVEGENQGTLKLVLVNPGPVDVQITAVEVGGQVINEDNLSCEDSSGNELTNLVIQVGKQANCETPNLSISAVPGTTLPGRVILSGGQSFPFTALVKPGTGGGGG